jgi:hypothetical protein
MRVKTLKKTLNFIISEKPFREFREKELGLSHTGKYFVHGWAPCTFQYSVLGSKVLRTPLLLRHFGVAGAT